MWPGLFTREGADIAVEREGISFLASRRGRII
jgi:hypothetical protein